MNIREFKDRFLATPWVYDTVRPYVAGGIDLGALAEFCALQKTDRVFDLGCGTAQLLEFLTFDRYLGADVDPSALERASRFAGQGVRFVEGDDWDEAYRELRPTVVLMIGVVHHVSDEVFHSIAGRLRQVGSELPRLVVIDVTYFPGRLLNNLLSRLDRGRHVRTPGQYESLYSTSGLRVQRSGIIPTRLRYVRYVGYHLALN